MSLCMSFLGGKKDLRHQLITYANALLYMQKRNCKYQQTIAFCSRTIQTIKILDPDWLRPQLTPFNTK